MRHEPRAYADLLALQSGVVSRRQLLDDAGLQPHDLQRLVRRRDLVRVHDGVFVDHTGDLTWLQRAWVGVHLVWPAALAARQRAPRRRRAGASGPGRVGDPPRRRPGPARARCPPATGCTGMAGFDERVMWNTSPPRVRIEEALIDVAVRKPDDFGAIAVLADAIQARRTQAAPHPRGPRRARRASLAATSCAAC